MNEAAGSTQKHKFTNRLINEKSPYLLQHAHNPVDWYPWGDEAFEVAKKLDKPIFLSVGYATCHWCHVMEHESFENEDIAKVMNEHFICIKVDREERPDVDNIYMTAVQILTRQGGWPMSVFMTPEGKPFFGGTYFPPTSRFGRPGFRDVLLGLSKSWQEERNRILEAAEQLTQGINSVSVVNKGETGNENALKQAGEQYQQSYEPRYGGFSPDTKFPRPHSLLFLLRLWERTDEKNYLGMVQKTLVNMADGGLQDHLGGGFHRYSVDKEWLVPHFEKMLYDQALLAMAYIEAWQVTDRELYAQTAKDIFTYVLRDMTDPKGGFYSAEDADSEGVEGKFYVWSREEILDVLGKEKGERFCEFYDVTRGGNFEGENILNRQISFEKASEEFEMEVSKLKEELSESRQKLFEVRKKRIHPLLDDKVLTSWNGLMIAAFAKGSRVFKEPKYLEAAIQATKFVLSELRQENGRLLRRWRKGEAKLLAYVDDYAFMIWGLIELYFATGESRWLQEALDLSDQMLDLFWDPESGGLLFSGKDGEKLISNFKEVYDGAIPSGNSVAAFNFVRLGHLTGNPTLKAKGEEILKTFAGNIQGQGVNHPQMLLALDFLLGPNQEVVLAGEANQDEFQSLRETVDTQWLPRAVLAFNFSDDDKIEKLIPYLSSQKALDGKPTAYVCVDYACQLPTTDVQTLREQLENFKN